MLPADTRVSSRTLSIARAVTLSLTLGAAIALAEHVDLPQPFVDLNALHPSQHVANGSGRPYVVIIDTSKPTAFPNGRTLVDDVDSAAGFTSLPTDPGAAGLEFMLCAPGAFACPVSPSATADDVRVQATDPFLGAPHGAGLQP